MTMLPKNRPTPALLRHDNVKDSGISFFFRRFVPDFKTLTWVCDVPATLEVYD